MPTTGNNHMDQFWKRKMDDEHAKSANLSKNLTMEILTKGIKDKMGGVVQQEQ
jgi:hypothetical protein